MIRLRSAVLVVVLLVASVGTASAECAWVLWVHEETSRRVMGRLETGELWQPITGVSSEGACANRLTAQMATVSGLSAKSPAGEKMLYRVGNNDVTILWYREPGQPDDLPLRSQQLSYSCLPDTIDPRGPKAR